jgi:hypothetical protein
MAYYRKKRTPAQEEADRLRKQIARTKRVNVLKEYQAQWDNPQTKPFMLARSASGRRSIAEHQAILEQAVQRFLQRQPESLTKVRWLDVLCRGYDQITQNARMVSPGSRPKLRAKDEANLFRTFVRKGYLRLDAETGLWNNTCRLM